MPGKILTVNHLQVASALWPVIDKPAIMIDGRLPQLHVDGRDPALAQGSLSFDALRDEDLLEFVIIEPRLMEQTVWLVNSQILTVTRNSRYNVSSPAVLFGLVIFRQTMT